MKFCWCTIRVNNMEDCIKFYKEIVGLSIANRYMTEKGKEICFLGDGETKVELIYDSNHKSTNCSEGISLGFEVESVDKMIKYIKEQGFEVESGPFQPSPKIKYFYVKDPNGFRVQFVEKI